MKTIRFMGDSTVYGVTKNAQGDWIQYPYNTPALAGILLNERLGAGSVITINDGKSGTTIEQWYYGDTAQGMPSMATRLASQEYSAMDAAVLEVGINNRVGNVTVDQFGWYIQQIKSLFSNNNKTLILSTPNPVADPYYAKLYQIQLKIKELAAYYNIPLIDHYNVISNSIPNWRDLLVDGVHPSNTLYWIKGSLAANVLVPFAR